MSTDTPETGAGTNPEKQHEWLQNLVGDWKVQSVMSMGPGEPDTTGEGTEKVVSLGGLWAFGEGVGTMPGGGEMQYKVALGYDLTFNEYRGCWFASVSSHLWKYTGTLSADGKTMTLECEGPDMMNDTGGTANYRDVIEIIDANHRTLTSYGQDAEGNWHPFVKSTYTRV